MASLGGYYIDDVIQLWSNYVIRLIQMLESDSSRSVVDFRLFCSVFLGCLRLM